MLSCFVGIVYSFGIELRDGPLSPCTLELPEDQGRRFIPYRDAFLFFRDCLLIWYRAEGWATQPLHPGAPWGVGGSYPTGIHSCFSGIVYSFGAEGWTTQSVHPGAPWGAGGSYPTGMLSCFVGIVYSFGIELRDGPLSPCTLELPEDQIIPTAEENFAALRAIFNRVYQAVVPAREI